MHASLEIQFEYIIVGKFLSLDLLDEPYLTTILDLY